MKTNFDNAVKILMEGRCEAIQPKGDSNAMVLKTDPQSVSPYLCWIHGGSNIPVMYFFSTWECLGYKPKTETSEKTAFVLVRKGRADLSNRFASKEELLSYYYDAQDIDIAKVTIKTERPIKE